jgi:hypothetical protein
MEQWRDTLLYQSGELESEGGKSLELDDPNNFRRTLYARVSRLQLNAVLMSMDYPDANVHAEKRATTTTAMQKLFQMNSEFMTARAKALAARFGGCDERVQKLYQTLFNRPPEADELKLAQTFLANERIPVGASDAHELSRWEQYAQALLMSNELMYVD